MEKKIKWWRISIGVLFFILLIGFIFVQQNDKAGSGYLNGQLFGNSTTYYIGLVLMLAAWIVIEVTIVKPNISKILIPTAAGMVLIAAILINGYIGLISGLILSGDICVWYLFNINTKNTKNTKTHKFENSNENLTTEVNNV